MPQHFFQIALSLVVFSLAPCTASAQIQFSPDRPTGENYHVEFAFGVWRPTPSIFVTSEALGIGGTTIDFVGDLGIGQKSFPEFRLVGRPATKHRFRLSYTPIEYAAETTINRRIIFNGQEFRIGIPVSGLLTWKSYRFGYEYDALYMARGFVGFIFEAKYTDVSATLSSPFVGTEFARARAPIPGLGGIGRVYVAPNISITGEITGFAVPDIDEEFDGKFVDVDVYGTVNYTDHFGAQIGYRRIDVNYLVRRDSGDLKMGGLYFMGVVRSNVVRVWAFAAAALLLPFSVFAQPGVVAEAQDAFVFHDSGARTWTIGNRTIGFSVGLDSGNHLRTLSLSMTPDGPNVLRGAAGDGLLTLDGLTTILGTSPTYTYRSFTAAATATTVEFALLFEHRDSGLAVVRHYRTTAATPVIEVWSVLSLPAGRREVVASGLNAWRLSVPAGTIRSVAGLDPGSNLESFTILDRTMRSGERLSFGSPDRSSNEVVPVFAVNSPEGAFFGGIMWSGAWDVVFDRMQDRLDVTLSLQATTRSRMRERTTLEAPHGFFGLVPSTDVVALALKSFAVYGLRGGRALDAPVTYNTWFVSGSRIDEESILDQMDHASELGAEVFVVDAGWYPGEREFFQFTAGLGVYDEDSDRFPNGLRALADYGHALGMKFGIWVEPERVDLAYVGSPGRAQSGWLATSDGKYGTEDSADEVPSAQICFAHPDAQQWIVDQISSLIERTGADYLKWDNNFWIDCDRGGHGHSETDGRFAHVNGLYSVLKTLRERFPTLMIENCSGGGRRIDFGLIQYTDVAWMDDRSGPSVHVRHNLQGLMQFFPAGYLFSFVMGGDEDPMHDSDDLPLLFRSRMSGMMGLGFPGHELNEGETEVASQEVAIYKGLRDMLKDSAGILLSPQTATDGQPPWEIVQHRSAETEEVIIFAFQNDLDAHEAWFNPVLLDAEQMYEVEILFLDKYGPVRGADLMRDGIVVPESSRSAAQIIVLHPSNPHAPPRIRRNAYRQ